MSPSVQLGLPPTEVKRVGTAAPTDANSLGKRLDLVTFVRDTADRLGMNDQQLASIFGDMTAGDFSKAFSHNWPERNRPMKQELPIAFARIMAVVMCESVGLTVSGADAERQAIADLVEVCSRFIRVVRR